jgi:hypothetical protein
LTVRQIQSVVQASAAAAYPQRQLAEHVNMPWHQTASALTAARLALAPFTEGATPETTAHDPLLAASKEIGWRGYLLPRLLPLGRNRALWLVGCYPLGLAHATDLPSPALPLRRQQATRDPALHRNKRGGELRLRISQDLHRQRVAVDAGPRNAQRRLGHFGSVHSQLLPVPVEEYLAGDNGTLILITTAVVAFSLGNQNRACLDLDACPIGTLAVNIDFRQPLRGFCPEHIARDELTSCAAARVPGAYRAGLTEHAGTPIAPQAQRCRVSHLTP